MRIGRPPALLIGVLALSSCSESRLWLPTEDFASVVLVLASGTQLRATAFDVTSSGALNVAADADDTDAYALLFEATLDAHQLRPGSQMLVDRGLSLASADAFASADLVADAPTWTSVDTLPERLDGVALALPPRCQEPFVETVRLPGTAGRTPGFAVAIGPERLFVSTREGQFFDVTRDGAVPITGLPTDTPSHAAFFDERSDEVWIIGERGQMVVGHPDRGFVRAPSMTTDYPCPRWIDGSRGDAPFELFAVTATATLERFDGEAWTRIFRPAAPTPLARSRWSVSWSGPGAAISTGWGDETLVQIVGGAATTSEVPLPPQPEPSPDALYSTAYVEGYGALIGTRYGRILQRGATEWNLLPTPPTDVRATAIAGVDDGLFAGGQRGVYWEYYPDFGYCPPRAYSADEPHDVVSISQGVVIVEEAADARAELRLLFISRGGR